MTIPNGTFAPPDVTMGIPIAFADALVVRAKCERIESFAGAAIGSAVLRFPAARAQEVDEAYGKPAWISAGGSVIFHGVVGDIPFDVADDSDQMVAMLYDDKWVMDSMIVGQAGVGSGDDGFQHVGLDVVFNEDGIPNKDPTKLDFSRGSTAVFWTLKNILQFLFMYYIPSRVDYSATGMNSAYDRSPTSLNLIGLTGLQAVDQVVALAGQTWGLRPNQNGSGFRVIRPGSGTSRTVRLFAPRAGGTVRNAHDLCPKTIRVNKTPRNCRDVHQAVSGRVVKERVHSNIGDYPLLAREATFKDNVYAARYKIDVTQYEDNNLGESYPAGARPKPWLSEMVTRIKADGSYITAAEMAATPAYLDAQRAPIPVWIAADGTKANAKLVAKGYRIDTNSAVIDFEGKLDVMAATGEETEELTITDWSTAGVWLTIPTLMETRESIESDEDSKFLPDEYYTVISKPDLVPEKREDTWLPDLAGTNNAIDETQAGAATEEAYVDVEDYLQDAVDSSVEASPEIETTIDMMFGFFPRLEIGDRIAITGRDTGATGNEVIVSLRFNVDDAYEVAAQATSITAGVDAERFIQ